MGKQYCQECRFYCQHYAINSQKIFRIYCGHCTYSRVLKRKPDAEICKNFSPITGEEPFVSKEYLSKELLQYMMNLELFPGIEEVCENLPE